MTYDAIHIGTSGWGNVWCENVLPPSIDADLIDVVAAVDIDESVLSNARSSLGLPADRCYTDIEDAFTEHDPDLCTVVVPPAAREEIVDVALEHDATFSRRSRSLTRSERRFASQRRSNGRERKWA